MLAMIKYIIFLIVIFSIYTIISVKKLRFEYVAELDYHPQYTGEQTKAYSGGNPPPTHKKISPPPPTYLISECAPVGKIIHVFVLNQTIIASSISNYCSPN